MAASILSSSTNCDIKCLTRRIAKKMSKTIEWALSQVPEGFLKPAVKNRKDYVDLVCQYKPKSVLDIGTGSIAIYLILLRINHPKLPLMGIEKNEISYKNATRVLQQLDYNNIDIRCSDEIPLDLIDKIDFVMCNPPFYSSELEISKCGGIKATRVKLNFGGMPHELVTDGGEVEFAKSFIKNLLLSKSVRYFSTLLGFKKSVPLLKNYIKYLCHLFGLEPEITVHKISYVTVRWVLIWRITQKQQYDKVFSTQNQNFSDFFKLLEKYGDLDLDGSNCNLILEKNTWSRAFRRGNDTSILKTQFISTVSFRLDDGRLYMNGNGLCKSFADYLEGLKFLTP
eukprot:NODE_40_length_35084_cov_0.543519.p12 type:complete len:340 gc:universal NODE_40_length_35084_cov_0.543519:22597-21578(-)